MWKSNLSLTRRPEGEKRENEGKVISEAVMTESSWMNEKYEPTWSCATTTKKYK